MVFSISKKRKETPVVIGTMETGILPESMGGLADQVYSKRGGQGDFIPALAKGLIDRGLSTYVLMPNLKSQFHRHNGVTNKEQVAHRHGADPRHVLLVESHYIRNLEHPYAGDEAFTAAMFQSRAFPVVKTLRAQHEGNLVYVPNDYMPAGWLSAYLHTRGVPIVQVLHNVHDKEVPLYYYFDTPMSDFEHNFYMSETNQNALWSGTTGVKNARKVAVVSEAFKNELVEGWFPDKVPSHLREELRAKDALGDLVGIGNGLYDELLPEHQDDVFSQYAALGAQQVSPATQDLVSAKKANLAAYQRASGLVVNPDATLFFWPSRLDGFQKGAKSLVETVGSFVQHNPSAQVAIVADPTNEKEDGLQAALTNIALASRGQIAYHPFDDALSKFAYSAASVVVASPSFEPFGYFIPQGFAAGDLVLTSRVGGAKDMLKEYDSASNKGNGLFIDGLGSDAFYRGLEDVLRIHRSWQESPRLWNKKLHELGTYARDEWGLERMIDGYAKLIEEANGAPLT